MSYYRKSFQPEKFSLDICELLSNKSHCAWSLFIKRNSLKSDILCVQVFQGPDFSGSRFLRVPVHGSGSKFQKQPFASTWKSHFGIGVFSCKFAAYLRTSFYKNTFKGLLLFLFIFYHSLVSIDLLYVGRAKLSLLKRIFVNIGEAQCLQMFFIVGVRD